jgi:hypothetical protein
MTTWGRGRQSFRIIQGDANEIVMALPLTHTVVTSPAYRDDLSDACLGGRADAGRADGRDGRVRRRPGKKRVVGKYASGPDLASTPVAVEAHPDRRVYTVKEAATVYFQGRVSQRELYNLFDQGEILGFRVGNVRAESRVRA